ncbi:MAG TPA: ABC transporter ATP-binding protein [Methylomirabilota bacterium]|nr:ABC transporter ATP-binding protein [Methylomirabilota bacterium]
MRSTTEALLEVAGLRVSYGAKPVVLGIDLRLAAGEIVVMYGPNGAGKTTTLHAIFGLLPYQGRVRLRGAELTGRPPAQHLRAGVTLIPQGGYTFGEMSVGENLELGAWTLADRRGRARQLEQVFVLFPVLAERRRQRAASLSGGERQMLAIGIGLMSAPVLLLIDEPSIGLAPLALEATLGKVKEINRELGTTILMVEQNVRQVLPIADRVYLMKLGTLVALDGGPAELLRNEALWRAYLG